VPGDLRPAEGCERDIHRTGLVAVFSVADLELALTGEIPRRLQVVEKVGFALLLDDGAELKVAACAAFAGLEQLHRALTIAGPRSAPR
jgi:hypothetical protein